MKKTNYYSTLVETTHLLPKYIDKILSDIDKSIVQLNTTQVIDQELSKIFENLSHFVSLVSIIYRDTLWESYDNNTMEVLKTLKIHQLSIIKALKSASKTDDLLMLADLLEYELKDNLTQWKISAIPQIKEALKRRKLINPTTSY